MIHLAISIAAFLFLLWFALAVIGFVIAVITSLLIWISDHPWKTAGLFAAGSITFVVLTAGLLGP